MSIHVKSHRRGKSIVKAHKRTQSETLQKLDRLVNKAMRKAISGKSSAKYSSLYKNLVSKRYELKSAMQRQRPNKW